MSSLTISIDRSNMAGSLDPLVLLGHVGSANTVLGVIGYREPARQTRVRYAPPSDFTHGDVALGWNWQQSVLPFTVRGFGATETQVKAAIAELEAAVARMSYEVTVTVSDAPALVWTCDPGQVIPVRDRSYTDLRLAVPAWSVEIPCHPVPEEA